MTTSPSTPRCPLCDAASCAYAQNQRRDYFLCAGCGLIFMDTAQRLDREAEHRYYALHRNAPDDPGYRRFLSPLLDALLAHLEPGSAGLDFGCGPGSALAAMLDEAGHAVTLYDPLFHPDTAVLQRRYDFIACSEVVEHLHEPLAEFQRLVGLLRPGGVLGLMTGFPPADAQSFAQWHYARDPTHVAFFGPQSLDWLARRLGLALEIPARNVALLHAGTAT